MEDPNRPVRAARLVRQRMRAAAAFVALSLLVTWVASASAQDRLAFWLQEPVPEDVPAAWSAPGRAVFPEWTWSNPGAGALQLASAEQLAAAGQYQQPYQPPFAQPQYQQYGQPQYGQPQYDQAPMTQAVLPPSSRRRFQFVSQQDPDPADVPPPASSGDQPPSDQGDQSSGDQPPSDENGEVPTKPIGREPQTNTMQFLRAQDVLLKQGAWQFDIGLVYTLFETQLPVAAVDGSGNVTDVVPGVVRRRLLYSPFAFRYGLNSDVQLFGILPTGYADTQTSTSGTSVMSNSGGQGDFTGGASFHVLKAHEDHPDGILTWSFTAPTGQYTSPLGTGTVIPGFSLGQGYWALAAQMLFINRYDPVIVFYGAGCRHLFQRRFDGIMVTAGEQINYQFGVGFSVNDRITLSGALQGFYITNTQIDGVTERGSNIEPISLRFAATMARRCRILEPFAIIGMTQTAPAASIGITWTFY